MEKNNKYFEDIKKDKSFNDQKMILDGTRDTWKPFGNYKKDNVEDIVKKARRL